MKSCVLKSYPNGIAVYLSDELEFSQLVEEVGAKFKEAGGFFKNAKLALSFEGRTLSHEEEEILLDAIQANCQIQVVCVVGKNEDKNQQYLKAISQLSYRHEDRNLCQLYKGTLKDGQVLETDDSIVIIGDVNPGCAVVSAKDIIIAGGLYGEAHAGVNGDNKRFVIALDMSFERLKIGDYRFRTSNEKKSFWPVKQRIEPKMAVVEDETVILKPMNKNNLGKVDE